MSAYRLLLVALVLVAIVLSACSLVPPPQPGSYPDRILFIGTNESAYNEGLDKHLKGMAREAVPPLYIDTDLKSITPPVQKSWQDPSIQSLVMDGDWDVVVLEGEFDRGTQDAESFAEYVRNYDQLIRSAGARPVLRMDWQVDETKQCIRCPEIGEIERVVTSVGSEFNSQVAPAGLAWERAMVEQPEMELYQKPNMHENDPGTRGTYLATAVLFSILFDQSPEGLSYDLEDVWPVHEAFDEFRRNYAIAVEDRAFLQRIAWETVQEYQEEHGSSQ